MQHTCEFCAKRNQLWLLLGEYIRPNVYYPEHICFSLTNNTRCSLWQCGNVTEQEGNYKGTMRWLTWGQSYSASAWSVKRQWRLVYRQAGFTPVAWWQLYPPTLLSWPSILFVHSKVTIVKAGEDTNTLPLLSSCDCKQADQIQVWDMPEC